MNRSDNTRFNWQQIQQRVDAAFADIERGIKLPPAQIRRILKARAKALAEVPDSTDATEFIEIVEFQLAHEHYAVETRYVREVYPLDNLTWLPGTPDFVMGVINIRGEILSVVDIKNFFGLPEKGITHLDKVIILESGGMVFGILADHLDGVRRLPITEMGSSRQSPAGIDSSYIQGITTSGLAILDAKALLADEKIIVQ